MQLQSKIPVKKTKIIACICLIVLIVVCSVLSNKEISKHKNDSSQNVSDDINIQKKTTIETSELQEKKSDIFVRKRRFLCFTAYNSKTFCIFAVLIKKTRCKTALQNVEGKKRGNKL